MNGHVITFFNWWGSWFKILGNDWSRGEGRPVSQQSKLMQREHRWSTDDKHVALQGRKRR